MDGRQRLSGQDALWLEMDRPGNLMVVDSLFWTEGPIDWDRFRDLMRERFWDRYAVVRSVVVRDESGALWWEEAPDADIDDRFEHVVLPAPGGDAELQQLISEQRVLPLDRGEPLWRALLVDGFHDGSAVIFRGHHSIADGIRMVQLVLRIFDTSPDGPARRRKPKAGAEVAVTRSAPEETTLTERAMSAAATSLQVARSAVTNPVGAAHSALALSESLLGRIGAMPLVSALPGDVDTARKLVFGTRNDTTAWTGTVGDRKAISWSAPLMLTDVKNVAHAHGATANDVLVSCVAQSLRAYLAAHQAVCNSVTWDVPVNLKPFDPSLPVELGNGFALVQLELPTNIEDPVRALDVVRRRMTRIKNGHEAVVDFGIQAAIGRMSTVLYRATIDLLANRAIGVLTNVPGPQVPLYVGGQKVEAMMGWAPLTADQVMSLTIYSYDGKVFVGLAADAGLVPDHQQIVGGFSEAFARLVEHTERTPRR
ncbi:WS/DGAT domain-containing protein [Nocardioides sp. T2.26MG-1]|uniref:WS/DGAT domain-containing protein n=1 Tax=Nocardioides sp. T2.26MG-1 TaxID=3041166 RepID=UPI0024774DED|nr:WS/DGAT domain-containing protein [Nocardioides sp. T2.26MG-1]CAI9417656.1 Putative diacyglycerol O-acyltransferase [Nocardioides sp. T2.26MG-1]